VPAGHSRRGAVSDALGPDRHADGRHLELGGYGVVKKLAFPLVLLCFMVPLPALIYNSITFPLQILATKLAEGALTLFDIPVLRQGNVLQLPSRPLSVVEACSGIRSLLSLTFLSLIYGYFFERKRSIRIALLLSTARPGPAHRRVPLRLPGRCSGCASGRTPCHWPAGAENRRNSVRR
jgi:hypothetical protein